MATTSAVPARAAGARCADERCPLAGSHAAIPGTGDGQLVEALAGRCREAFDEIHRRHASSVLAMSRRSVYDAGTAEDVAQEVLLSLWLHPERFEADRGGLKGYLSMVARGRAIDRVRADGARRARELGEGRDEGVGDGLDGGVIRTLDAQRVRRALAVLPADQRVPLELAFFQDHTYLAVSVVLGLPEGTVKSRIRAGLLRLRAALAVEAPTPEPARSTPAPGPCVEYRIDADDRLTTVGDGWAQFAQENGAPELASPSATRTLWDHLEGDGIGALWELLVLRVRLTQRPVRLPYRCDAPRYRRWFDMTLTPEPDDTVHFRSVLTRETPRDEVVFTVAPALQAAEALVVCSWCARCEDRGRWTPFEDYVRRRRTMQGVEAPAITHDICPACADLLRAEIVQR